MGCPAKLKTRYLDLFTYPIPADKWQVCLEQPHVERIKPDLFDCPVEAFCPWQKLSGTMLCPPREALRVGLDPRLVLNYGKKHTVPAMLLHEILDIAISITGADKGNVQLFTPETRALTIAAQRGFDATFLKYFKKVHNESPGAAAATMRSVEPVIVEDVTTDQIFVGNPSMNVVINANARAILCVPIVGLAGNLLGVISTHFRDPHRPAERELGLVRTLAQAASACLDGRAARLNWDSRIMLD